MEDRVSQAEQCSTYNASRTHCNFVETVHDANLDVLGTGLDNFQKTLDRQFDRFVTRHIILVVLLEELSDCFGRAADGIRLLIVISVGKSSGTERENLGNDLPGAVDPTGLSHV